MIFTPAGRSDFDALARLSNVFVTQELNETPFLVFVEDAEEQADEYSLLPALLRAHVTCVIVKNATALLTYPDATWVMVQWRGKTRDDFFKFQVSQLRKWSSDHLLAPPVERKKQPSKERNEKATQAPTRREPRLV